MRSTLILFICFLIFDNLYSQGVVALKCEYLTEPLGIDEQSPRFSWQIEDNEKSAKQTAFQIAVTDPSNKTMWNSGKIKSDKNLVRYEGEPLQPFTKYSWKLVAWNKDENPYPETSSSFETGMVQQNNWKGMWISDGIDVVLKPAPYFRKLINTSRPIQSARAYISAGGLFELYINGEKIGNHKLDPVYTRFDRRNLYVTHDITPQLQTGENAIGVLLGNGWYNHQSTAVWYFDKAPWRNRPSFCMDIRVQYTDGTVETFSTDRTWKTSLSPVIFNSIYTAEHYDARLEQKGWNTVSFSDSAWTNAIPRTAPSQKIVSQQLHPIREVTKIEPVGFRKFSDTNYVFDLGRNISGVSEIKVQGQAGTIIRLKHGERLYKNGHVDISNIDVHYRPKDSSDPFQTDIFILGGNGEEVFKPKFNYKGFQYIEVNSSQPVTLSKNSLTGYFMHSDVPVRGFVNTSNETINKIWTATNNAYLSNLFGYPTDCPQREKNGWTGDAHIAAETGLYNFDGFTVYEKWLADHRDEQQPNGVLPSIIPSNGWGYEWGNGPDWTSTIAIIPWTLYKFYGDKKPLQDNYDNIKRYVDNIERNYPTGLTTWGLGDWVPVKSVSPVELTSSVYYFADATILSKAAQLTNNTEDHRKYAALAEKIKNAINKKYLDTTLFIYGSGLQTELAVPLFWNVVPTEYKQKVAAKLVEKVTANNYKLDVGILGAKAILFALSENGFADVAYKIASSETYPSWGWWIKNGATTLYENWNIDAANDISLNHIMFGAIGEWLFKGPGGIYPDELEPGFKHIFLRPSFVPGLNSFNAGHTGPQGEIISGWKRKGKQIFYEFTIPANSHATLQLPKKYTIKELSQLKINSVTSSNFNQYHFPSGSYKLTILD